MGRLPGAAAVLLLVVVAAGSACSSDGGPVSSPSSALGAGGSDATDGVGFSSAQYGYAAAVPAGWSLEPATSQWDGGDIDHRGGYADRFDGAGLGLIFTIGTPTDDPLAEFAEAHVSWVEANRGCARASDPVDAVLDGVPAVRLALRCPQGIYGATLVNKAVVLRDGVGVIFTAFSPDSGSDMLPAFDDLVASVRWTGP